MSVEAVRCGRCHCEYRKETNLLTGKPVWLKPKTRHTGCAHSSDNVQIKDETGRWASPSDPERAT